ncbi:HAD family hydrolase [Microbacterium hydrocarbonoxydans]|uniref:HAD family hydrolase n=1 Tax=Microbacterium hydrocarbonoxydans TaxID=273678 RepID=UPI00204028B6|nr:HAD-IA family hydrolase [Microbacterium hydrocarbonoxydans]MCM3779483.1 HAD-IA family hydrolase [Microbacterium hydrocarbonoxydans]
MPKKPWILFDIGGVLEVVDDDSWQEQWWERVRGVSGLMWHDLDARLAAADLPRIDLTVGTEGAFWAELARALDLDDEQRSAIRADFWDAYCGTGNHELIEYARSLRGRARTAILSNSADGAREEEERRFGFASIFDPICYSHELGVAKPEPQAYLRTLQALDADPAEVLFIDDHQTAIDGAVAVGIRGILHRDNTTTIAAIESFLAAG